MHTYTRHNALQCKHVVSQYELSGQQLSKFVILNMYIFKEEECEEKIAYFKKKLASLKWMPEPVKKN